MLGTSYLKQQKNSHKVSNWPNKVESNYAAGWRGLEKLIFISLQSTCKETKLKDFQFKLIQGAKKVVSDSPGLVYFAIGLVNSVLNLPDRQAKIFRRIKITKVL